MVCTFKFDFRRHIHRKSKTDSFPERSKFAKDMENCKINAEY